MAVEVQPGFSIRNYVAKMRTIDMAKCRPFDDEPLPPMDVRMFRWWADEVAVAAPPPPKQRTSKKKKRSIVELFAVSPQITAVTSKTDEEDVEPVRAEDARTGEKERVEEVSGGQGLYYADLESVSKREESENKLLVKNCGIDKNGKKLKNKMKKKKLQIKISATQKQKNRKPAISSSLSISQLIQDVKNRKKYLKKSLKSSTNSPNKKKKTPSILSKKENCLKSSPSKSQIKNCSVQSILKNHIKTNSPLKKQVRFSGKDDVLLGNKKCSSSSPIDMSPVTFPVSEQSELVCEKGTETQTHELIFMEKSQRTINSLDVNDHTKEKSPLRKQVDLNQIIEIFDSCIEIRAEEIKQKPEITKEPSSSCLINKSSQISNTNTSSRDVLQGPVPILNKDVISVSSSTGSNKSVSDTRLNADFMSNNICFDEEYVGLPLNSRGELTINPNSNPNPNSTHLFYRQDYKKPVTIMPKIKSTANNNINQANLQMGPLYYKDTFGTEHYYTPLMPPVRPGFGYANMPGFEAMEIHPNGPSISFQMERNTVGVEPTVRLMGKNVRLGKNNHESMGFNSRPVHVDFSNGFANRPHPHVYPVTRYSEVNYQMPAQQILLNSTHCKHSQSQNLSFASSSSLPQWILNPKSKTHKPSFPTYTNSNNIIYGNNHHNNNNPNLSCNYPLMYPPYVAPRPKMQPRSKYNAFKPSDYINAHNKRVFERDNGFVRPPPKNPRLETGLTRPVNKRLETGNRETSQSKYRSGPVKLSPGARHVLKPGPDMDPVNSRPVYCTTPLTCGTGTGRKSAEIYRF